MSWRLAFHSTKVLFSYLIPYKMTSFREAILNGNIPRIRQLADERPRLIQQAIDADGNTALGLAIELGEVDVVKTLLELGSDPNIANAFDGNHPLVILAKLRSEENSKMPILTDLLLSAGSDPLYEVRYQADTISRIDVTQTPSFHETPLLCSIRFQNEVLLRKLIERGVDINAPNPETGISPLMLAAELGYINMCNILIDAGANINACDHANNTALHLAIQGFGDKMPVIQALIEHGADPNIANDDGFTAIMFAGQMQDEACLKLLQSKTMDRIEPPKYQEVDNYNAEQTNETVFSFT
ncbi:unnamed protein product [Rotaria sp. Silwood1]|nr:unnamed protein product [Rotaria sp. Silwood1]CAF3438319.1 unnamed protein product [Rotaria sp. Silwood1]CAF3439143.1 unnamed protein product [Rotaria sp. Silwood1]CAF3455644.1 unnamed protein product [Rotaria sp. Silwood1]CAF4645705.1 unnamed protein product [Rotaria sp. Silwood1]